MNTEIAYEKNGKQFNRFHQEVIDCQVGCGRKTTMTGTGLCDFCWEAGRSASDSNQTTETANMNDSEHLNVLVRLDDRQGWHILVHASGPDSFSKGCAEAIEHHRLCHNEQDSDVLLAVGLLNKMGDKWQYGEYCDYPVRAGQSRAAHDAMWQQIVDAESWLSANTYARAKAIEQAIEQARPIGRYICFREPLPAHLPGMACDQGTLGAWFY